MFEFGCGWASSGAYSSLQNDLGQLRDTYDTFLHDYPLCYGYWQKYADAEARHGDAESAAAVYERGVAAIATSADLWLHYCKWKEGPGGSPAEIRR